MRVALIPARGGSKRIPRKNIREFAGKPMIAHSINCATRSKLFDRIVVSTDDPEIREIAVRFGAEVPYLRPAELADDYSGTIPVIQHALNALAKEGTLIEHACCIYATAPLLSAADLRSAYVRLVDSGAEYVFSATSFPFPVQRAIRLCSENRVEPVFPDSIARRSQDLEPLYHDAGQFYWAKASAFLSALPIFAPHSEAYLVPRHRVQDIDSLEDWKRAELLYQILKASPSSALG